LPRQAGNSSEKGSFTLRRCSWNEVELPKCQLREYSGCCAKVSGFLPLKLQDRQIRSSRQAGNSSEKGSFTLRRCSWNEVKLPKCQLREHGGYCVKASTHPSEHLSHSLLEMNKANSIYSFNFHFDVWFNYSSLFCFCNLKI